MPSLTGALMSPNELQVTADRLPGANVKTTWLADSQIASGGFSAYIRWRDEAGEAELAIRCGWNRIGQLEAVLRPYFGGAELPKLPTKREI